MKTEREIKILLSGIENPERSDDPEILKAWEQVKEDPDLLRWFEAQQRFDDKVRGAFFDSEVPDGFAQELLEQAEFVTRSRRNGGVGFFASRWTGWAAAAVILLFGGIFFFKDSLINNQNFMYLPQWSDVEKENNFRDAMAVWVDDTFISLDYLSEDQHSIRQWLVGQGGAQLKRFPTSFDHLDTLGCKTLKWKGNTVSLVCFHYGDEGQILHMFVMDRKGTSGSLVQNLEGLKRVRNRETGGWLTPTHAVLLVGSDPKVKVGSMLDQTSI